MKIFKHSQFAQQLVVSLAIVLIIVFFFVSAAFVSSIHQFIGNNAYKQSEAFVENIWSTLKTTIVDIEQIPFQIINIHNSIDSTKRKLSPANILKSHSQLIGVSLHYRTTNLDAYPYLHTIATRSNDGSITRTTQNHFSFHELICQKLKEQDNKKGVWIYSQVNNKPTIAFCHPIQNTLIQHNMYLKLDISLESIANLLYKYKLCESGFLFFIDSSGNYLSHSFNSAKDSSDNKATPSSNISKYFKAKIAKGETGCSIYEGKESTHFVYYSPISFMKWHIGIVSPYNGTLSSPIKLYWSGIIYLAGAFMFIFVCIQYIVHLQALPLKKLSLFIHNIVDRQFKVNIPHIKSTKEITDLYDSFRYMQYRIIDHIDKLKISTAEQEKINTEMHAAQRIQQSFLSKPIKLPTNLELAAELQQSRKVGGDLFQFFISENRLYFAIGDVAGKGVPASLYMASVSKLFRYIAKQNLSTATICNIINGQMYDDSDYDMYITMFVGILDIDTGVLTYTNAGHPYPIIIDKNIKTSFLSEYPDVPVGILEDHTFAEHTYTLENNSSLLLYTDGITDAENCAGQFYETDRLTKCIESMHSISPKEVIKAVLKDIETHIETRQQSDDLTLLMLRYHKS